MIGHGVSRVGLERQLAAGQLMVAHTEEYMANGHWRDAAQLQDLLEQVAARCRAAAEAS